MQILLINLFLIIPLFVWQGRFEAPKIMTFLFGSILLCIFWIFNITKVKIYKKDYWYLGWVLTLLISGILGDYPRNAILGGSYRHQGFIFFFGFWLLIKFFEISKPKQYIYKFVGIVAIIESLLVIFGKKLGTLGEINAISGLLAIGIFFVYRLLPRWLTVFPILAMIVNFSKTGFLALVPYFFKKNNIILILLLVVLVFVVKPINNTSRFENRQVIWGHALNLIMQKPIIGYGAETNEMIFDKAFYESGFPLSNLMIDRSHNLFLDITLWSGITGLIFFIGFLVETYKRIDEDRQKMFLSFLIYSMFQPLSVAHWILFAVII